jgi:hypothetical protein
MADEQGKEEEGHLEEEVWNAISAFEQILEAMPEDRASLEALAHAYEQIGDHTRAKDYLTRLAQVLIDESQTTEAKALLEKLRPYAAEDPRARELVTRIEGFGGPAPAPVPVREMEAREGARDDRLGAGLSMADELSFAWKLMEDDELTQEEYSGVVQDLTEMSAKDNQGTVSVMHVLELRGFRNLERIMRKVSVACGTPIVTMSSFDLRHEAVSLLPLEYMIRRGVAVFELAGQHALIVVMNPYDKQLQKDLEALTERTCHFYTALPSDFDAAIGRINDVLALGPEQDMGA